jgi:phosphoribosylformylglycinamidine synthase
MAMASGIGATVKPFDGGDPIPQFFGEDQGRYLVTLAFPATDARFEALQAQARELGISASLIGTTGGSELKLGNARAIPVGELTTAHESWFPRFMGT